MQNTYIRYERLHSDFELHAVMYHYVRDLPNTRFPRINGLMLDEFHEHVRDLASRYEMATLESALEFMRGTYTPARDLCILTFDDGLKEHHRDVAPILSQQNIQGLFGVITSCVEDRIVAPVHMNHFLTAELGFEYYCSVFTQRLRDEFPELLLSVQLDPAEAQRSYPLDTPDVATFKFLFNFALEAGVRDKIVGELFASYIGDQESFAHDLYMNWGEIRELQRIGMLVAGHTHRHRPLSTLRDDELNSDLCVSRSLLNKNLDPQDCWPFSYPYGKRNSYSKTAIQLLKQLGYTCAFGTEDGPNTGGTPLFELRRVDCNSVKQLQS